MRSAGSLCGRYSGSKWPQPTTNRRPGPDKSGYVGRADTSHIGRRLWSSCGPAETLRSVEVDDHRDMDQRGDESDQPTRRRDGRVVFVAIMLAAVGVAVLCYLVVISGRAVGGVLGQFKF